MDYNLFRSLMNANEYGAIRSWREGKHSRAKAVRAKGYLAKKRHINKISKMSRRANRIHK